ARGKRKATQVQKQSWGGIEPRGNLKMAWRPFSGIAKGAFWASKKPPWPGAQGRSAREFVVDVNKAGKPSGRKTATVEPFSKGRSDRPGGWVPEVFRRPRPEVGGSPRALRSGRTARPPPGR